MRNLFRAMLCASVLGAVVGTAPAADPPKAPAKADKCTLDNCCQCPCKKESFEDEGLWKLAAGACWCKLAKYNVTGKTEKDHAVVLDTAYADARKNGKIILYVANTGG